ncbi:putative GMC oxidoreductase [Annulohypoxylon truncatum]|uniref:putative GMC oxidoreductase n=1 Tax=Annulohypoxylon truncatum TaxID=327061 RepID=UPI0020085AEE|nr:putative GMC oxidoreductase [Annulohypoxylon truncatum]KAI1207908.1 putative GMC oxidoreductase [Annulohypoxylon truncatum]
MEPTRKEYDFVIIGGGTAGLVVAARLTENPRSSVLGTDLDWDFITVPQENLNNRQIGQPQGRVLGGSSAVNAEVFVPPSKVGFDAWEALGNPGWGWDDVAPYFRKFHTLVPPDEAVQQHLGLDWMDESTRGTGPVKASFSSAVEDPLGKAWVETFKQLGINFTGNPFGGGGIGGWSVPAAIDPVTKTRSYAASAYYAPASSRSNLEVITHATVSKIILNNANGITTTARGVSFKTQSGIEHEVKASREVILAAGAFQSPKILELSGIGDESLLNKFGITTKVNNPNVGENLQDHIMTGVSFEAAEGVMTGDILLRQEPELIQAAMQMYQEHKTGPLASAALVSYAFLPIMNQILEKLEPQLQRSLDELVERLDVASMSEYERQNLGYIKSLLQSANPGESTGSLFMLPAQVNLHNGPKQAGMTKDVKPGNYVSIGASLQYPLSRGNTHISSSDPSAPPVIDPRYLSHPLDIEMYARHLMLIEIIAKTPPFSNYLKPGGRRAQPGEAKVDTLEKAKAHIRESVLTDNHLVGTCAMLPREKGGVVDDRLRVYSVKGLRIVDSSIMPLIPRANVQTSVYTVAEKAADIIKEDHGLLSNKVA